MQEGIYTATEFREPALEPGMPYQGSIETLVGTFEDERDAIEAARSLWKDFRTSDSHDVAWWIVRRQGEDLARWIAESRSSIERVLDLTTHELVELEA
ncbi:MAG: hypothetical protein U9N84_05170 [Actinomycetota bacterium]|nr:hypothetical protein [Actinomycetota bacterium]